LTSGKKIFFQKHSLFHPTAMDVDLKSDRLYIIDQKSVFVQNLKEKGNEISHAWNLPYTDSYDRNIKIDNSIDSGNDNIYITIGLQPQIFIYSKEKKELKKVFGKKWPGRGMGEFTKPSHLAIDQNYLYICDTNNHRIQVLDKETGHYISQWGKKGCSIGQFEFPSAIYLISEKNNSNINSSSNEDLFYITDNKSIQLFNRKGKCVQRIEERAHNISDIHYNYGLCLFNGLLYISDNYEKQGKIRQDVKKKKAQS